MSRRPLSQKLFPLEPEYRERVWGGQRLKANNPPYGEAWLAFDASRVAGGKRQGQTVAQLAADYPEEFMGLRIAESCGTRFPLLVKILDCADWLSVQVHPNDEQARRLIGPDSVGKTEAWHFLDVQKGSIILGGCKPGTTPEALEHKIRHGGIEDIAQRVPVRAGETYLLHAGTLHAIGPGVMLYEIQQASDTTYRVYDWGRKPSPERPLHIEESVTVTDPCKAPILAAMGPFEGRRIVTLVRCPYFQLELLQPGETIIEADTGGDEFHILTVIDGSISVRCDGEMAEVGRFETTLVAGSAGQYAINASSESPTILRATVPREN
jgi:mannose-6-phosphate isomerase